MPIATDWFEILVPPVWSALLLVLLLFFSWLLRRPLARIVAAMGVSRLSVFGVDVDWIADRAGDAYTAREQNAPGRKELRAFALLSIRLAPLIDRRRILWVDDEPNNNKTEAMLLRRLGVDVENAWGTEAAIEQISLNPTRFDLVISDWTRDGNTEAGPELLEELGRRAPDLPVLMYVADATGERRATAAELGAKGLTSEPDELLKQALVELATADGG